MRWYPIAVVMLSLSAPAAASAVTDRWEKTYPITDHHELRVRTDDGSVKVETWDRHAIGLRVTTRGWRIRPNGVRIDSESNRNRVDLEVKSPHFTWSVGFTIRSIQIDVWLPPDADLDIGTGDGSVSVGPLEGHIRIHTGDGSISVDGLKGDIDLHTGDGSIRGRGLDGALIADTGDGSVEVDGRFDRLEVETGDGNITAEVETGSRLDKGCTMSTGDGHLVLRIPGNLKADLDAHTGDGHISLGFPIEVSGELTRTSIRGALNGGGPTLKLRSGDGSIRVEKL